MPRPRARTVALGGLAAFVVLVAVQHALRADELPPADHFVSEYANGDGGFLQVIAFLCWGASIAATARLATRRRAGRRRIARGLVVLGLAAGAVGAGAGAGFAPRAGRGEPPPGAAPPPPGRAPRPRPA